MQTDWLNCHPVFYNTRTQSYSHCIHDVIELDDIHFHPEGLKNYLAFGYSVFGQTPLENIKFLGPCEKISKQNDRLIIEQMDNPCDHINDYVYTESELIELIRFRLNEWLNQNPAEIILPLSGGYDSRLIASLINDRSRVRAFSYGLSAQQTQSFEVLRAKTVADMLDISWMDIPLGDFHDYFDDWESLFGPSTHAHGMYHFEFYQKITEAFPSGGVFLSGICGDAWAGSISPQIVKSPEDISKLAYSHGLHADDSQLKLKVSDDLLMQYWQQNQDRISIYPQQIIAMMHMKIILLSYLLRVPEHFGFQVWSPFLLPEICLGMLNLPHDRRKNRIWQQEYFQSRGLYVETRMKHEDMRNVLNYDAIRRRSLQPLSTQLLSPYFNQDYLLWINHNIKYSLVNRFIHNSQNNRIIGPIMQRLNIKDETLQAYAAYLTLKPIENLLIRKEGLHESGASGRVRIS